MDALDRLVPSGLVVSVARTDYPARRWSPHTMRKTVWATPVGGSSGAVVLKCGEWLILTRKEKLDVDVES